MKRKLDIILKIIITAAILVTLLFITLPALRNQGIITSGVKDTEAGNRPGAPAGTAAADSGERPSGSKPSGGERPSGGQAPAGRSSGASGPAASGQAVKAITVAEGTVSNYIKVNGDIVTDTEIDLYPDVSGVIISQNLQVGDRVEKDQTVAVVDPSLPGQNFAESAVYSTIGGTILGINARVGDKVTANSSIMTIGDLSDLKLVTYVPERFAGSLRTGLPAEISLTAWPDETFSSVITRVNPVIDPESRTMEITLSVNDRSGRIKPGMFASVKLVTEQVSNVISVPAQAIFTYYGKNTVFIINKDNTVERKEIITGLESIEMVEITEGLEVGDMIVTEGQSLLKDGSTVKVIE